ncbi:MAG: DUF2330 domain-containing protein [Elusimicrobia bacterium]|nr:DUF2330 domain-containing protein [Elusimicrobiota bacterium]
MARLALALWLLSIGGDASAFCGFYVASADAKLYNQASQVVLVRDGDRTVISMANDYRGEATNFALVVPVPVVLKREQIHVGDPKLFERIDAFSAPRLVEYHDEDPCRPRRMYAPMAAARGAGESMKAESARERAKALGVTIEGEYTIGEYDIVILGAKQSDGLETWLRESGYRIPAGASRALQPYIRQKLKFFVAKVNLGEHKKLGAQKLRPLQFAYEDARFMLPIRLGMINADGPQDLLIYALTRSGRVESTNYRTVKLPSDEEIPEYVKGEFPAFYRALFARAHEREDKRAVFTEYVWNMGWCDPCASDPLTPDELRRLGVFWLDEQEPPSRLPMPRRGRPMFGGGGVPVMVTRLHARYDAAHFPEDLVFQNTGDQSNYQGRYVLRHAWTGGGVCEEAKRYPSMLRERREREAQNLARLTGWELAEIRKKMDLDAPPKGDDWYKKIFKD